MATNAQVRAMSRYRHKTMAVVVRVNPRTERTVYERLERAENKAGYIKSLILDDAKRQRRGSVGGESE